MDTIGNDGRAGSRAERVALIRELTRGLVAATDYPFPKKCGSCGAVYRDLDEFIAQTEAVFDSSGLVEAIDHRHQKIVGLYRNCACGSTLLMLCRERRDCSPSGVELRETFGHLMRMLEQLGAKPETARAELLKIVHGQPSAILDKLLEQTPTEQANTNCAPD